MRKQPTADHPIIATDRVSNDRPIDLAIALHDRISIIRRDDPSDAVDDCLQCILANYSIILRATDGYDRFASAGPMIGQLFIICRNNYTTQSARTDAVEQPY